MRAKTTKSRTCRLFKRGDNFYVRWSVEGKVFSKALRDDSGNFFFFQAEDGIRDDLVTGVQTCALPISPPCAAPARRAPAPAAGGPRRASRTGGTRRRNPSCAGLTPSRGTG